MAKHIIDPDNINGGTSPAKTWSPLEEILIWVDEQIDEARQAQIDGFRSNDLFGERAHARHCTLFEVRQKLRSHLSDVRGADQ
jgi:hypothetical protein